MEHCQDGGGGAHLAKVALLHEARCALVPCPEDLDQPLGLRHEDLRQRSRRRRPRGRRVDWRGREARQVGGDSAALARLRRRRDVAARRRDAAGRAAAPRARRSGPVEVVALGRLA